MFSGWLLSLMAVGYLGSLFAIAFYGDRRRLYTNQRQLRPYIYALALGVYCTSWTFFGAVGSAVSRRLGVPADLSLAGAGVPVRPAVHGAAGRDWPRAQGQFDRGFHSVTLWQEPRTGGAGDADCPVGSHSIHRAAIQGRGRQSRRDDRVTAGMRRAYRDTR